jgi:hypothetical protein
MSIWIDIFFEIMILNSYPIWPNIMAIFVIKNWCITIIGFQYPLLESMASTLLHLLVTIELINGRSIGLFTWVVIIELMNTIWSLPETLIVVVGSAKLQPKFLIVKTPLDPIPNFVVDPISISFLTTFMLGVTTVSTLVVVIPTQND